MGEQIVLELDKNDATAARYTLAPFGYGDLVSQRRSNATSFFHFDAIGATRALTDASQAVTDTYIMRAFGAYRATTGSTLNRYRYIGKLGYYQETALSGFLLRRRYYTPDTGRFMSRDPVRTVGVSEYGYVRNCPVVLTDPSGLLQPSAGEIRGGTWFCPPPPTRGWIWRLCFGGPTRAAGNIWCRSCAMTCAGPVCGVFPLGSQDYVDCLAVCAGRETLCKIQNAAGNRFIF